MYNGSNVAYIYDGSFDGLMNCVYESFKSHEIPHSIINTNEGQLTLFERKFIETDIQRAIRVKNNISSKCGKSLMRFIQRAYLTCLGDKEKKIIIMVHLGFKYGEKSLKMLDNRVVNALHKAVGYLGKESHLLREFIRFSIYDSVMIAQITPKNFVLPFLAPHFVDRFPEETFLIYDTTHKAALVYEDKHLEIKDIEEFRLAAPQKEEIKYRRLWKSFYYTIGIKSRENPKCRMSHMPKRYWQNLTEFIWDKDFDNDFYFSESGDSFFTAR